MAVFRCYTEKKTGFDIEAGKLNRELNEIFGIDLDQIRAFNRYDIEGVDSETFESVKRLVLSEHQTDICYDEQLPELNCEHYLLVVESLPGQFDQRADSCAQCIQLMTKGERPAVRTAKVYVFIGYLTEDEKSQIESHLINPVESRKADLSKPETLQMDYELPEKVEILDGFTALDRNALEEFLVEYGLAMDLHDLLFFQEYFITEKRDPTLTELRVIDTYWSDHCRHTTFSTHLTEVKIEDERINEAFSAYLDARKEVYGDNADSRPITLMDIATMGMKLMKRRGLLPLLDESDEVNACSVKVTATVDGKPEEWLMMFKNETHNHPTEIEPFGGAGTCLGGAIRDPLSGRSYVYQAMRITGAGDPTVPVTETLEGKLPQRKITTTAALGYSAYGNQIGVPAGLVSEIYHPGYVAKRMELGAVVAAAPIENVVRMKPVQGDLIVLLGGRTGRDGCGGATGSSKAQTISAFEECAAEVQKGNPPEERNILRLFRDPKVTRLIKKCNDFGAGGVSVAIGELADGLFIDLDRVPTKYAGLDGTELAISESQERMAVVVAETDAEKLIEYARVENLEATVVAHVIEEPRLKMTWNGQMIVDISREFLNSNGAIKSADVHVSANHNEPKQVGDYSSEADMNANPEQETVFEADIETDAEKAEPNITEKLMLTLVSDINVASQQGLVEHFDSTVGASAVLVPMGGKTQKTPTQVMASLFPSESSGCTTCSVMSYGFDPYLSEKNPFIGGAVAVVQSLSKLVSAGCSYTNAYLSLQEFFERLGEDPKRWAKPFSALLGAFEAQERLQIASIGGKDSMSGTFMDMDVPPTLVSFAIAPCDAENVISPEFKTAGNPVYLFRTNSNELSAIDYDSLKSMWTSIHDLITSGKVVSAWTVGGKGIAEGIFKMALGNRIGFKSKWELPHDFFFEGDFTSIIVEAVQPLETGVLIGRTTAEPVIELASQKVSLDRLVAAWEAPLEQVFPTKVEDVIESGPEPVRAISYSGRSTLVRENRVSSPLAIIPVFPGTNSEYDTIRAVEDAGGRAETVIIRNLSAKDVKESAEYLAKCIADAQMIILPGGASGGNEPDGSAKYIATFFRDPAITEATHNLLYKRDGLMLGLGDGFQALVKLGLLPFGEIRDMDDECPSLTYNILDVTSQNTS